MSDHRFAIDVKFSIYGQDFDWDASLNWVPDNQTGVDPRITEWFANCYAQARSEYDTYEEMQIAQQIEKTERATLARLKAKYELSPNYDDFIQGYAP